MTNEQAAQQAKQFPHLSPEYFAFYDGRNSVRHESTCNFTDAKLVDWWNAGRREVLAEDRLNADTEWDEDAP